MWNKFRQFVTDIAPPYEDRMTRHAERQAAYERLRDEFAMAALIGLLSSPSTIGRKEEFCRSAYEYADAMMEEREKNDG